jgi:uncharacterized membrane protein HdeD (DUF308 family)
MSNTAWGYFGLAGYAGLVLCVSAFDQYDFAKAGVSLYVYWGALLLASGAIALIGTAKMAGEVIGYLKQKWRVK